MELKQKHAQAYVEGLKELMVNIEWSSGADFDLAVAYEAKDGTKRIVYFGDRGSMNEFPYIYLSEDMGVNDQAGDNKETLRITNLELMNFVHIICWDYGGVEQGRAARFKESDIKLNVLDSNGGNYDLSLDTGDLGNVAVLATIDNSNSIGAKLINVSKAGTLKGLRHSDQLFGIIEGG